MRPQAKAGKEDHSAQEPSSDPVDEHRSDSSEDVKSPAPRKSRSRGSRLFATFVVAALVVAVIGAVQSSNTGASVARSSSSVTASPSKSATPTSTLKAPLSLSELLGDNYQFEDAPLCESIGKILAESSLAEKSERRTELLQEIKDAWDASDFVQDNNWVSTLAAADIIDKIRGVTDADFNGELRDAPFEGAFQLESNFPSSYTNLSADFRDLVIESCGYESTYGLYRELERQASRVQSLANNVPWYPKDYYRYNSTLAWEWTDGTCSYYGGYCWHVNVVTKDGCDTLYAVMNILDDNEAVIGWTNDTARRLQPGDKAKLEFTTYEKDASLGRLVELTCY